MLIMSSSCNVNQTFIQSYLNDEFYEVRKWKKMQMKWNKSEKETKTKFFLLCFQQIDNRFIFLIIKINIYIWKMVLELSRKQKYIWK